MALQLALDATQTGIGVVAPEAYVRVETMQFNDQTACRFRVSTFFDQAARQTEGMGPIKVDELFMDSFDHNLTQSPKTQLYTYLKTLPLYTSAADV